ASRAKSLPSLSKTRLAWGGRWSCSASTGGQPRAIRMTQTDASANRAAAHQAPMRTPFGRGRSRILTWPGTTGRPLFLPNHMAGQSFRPERGIHKVLPMRIERLEDGGRCELRLRGELRLSNTHEVFERALAEDCARVVLDFSGCEVEDRALSALAE